MSSYTSKPAIVARPAEDIYNHFADLTSFEGKLNDIPAEQRAALSQLKFEPDAITVVTPQLGEMRFVVMERQAPVKVVFGAEKLPIPLTLTANFKPIDPDHTEVTTSIDVNLPPMLRPLVGSKLNEAAEKFGEMIGNLAK